MRFWIYWLSVGNRFSVELTSAH